MGVRIGRIVKEFVFRNLLDQKIPIKLCGQGKETAYAVVEVREPYLLLEPLPGEAASFRPGEKLQVYFLFQNNYHTFESSVLGTQGERLHIAHPEGVYKNPQRKYSRVRPEEEAEIFFTLQGGQTVALNFPLSPRGAQPASPEEALRRRDFNASSIQGLHKLFKEKMAELVSYGKIVMLRDKVPDGYDEKLLAATGKMLWIPSTEEDFPATDPFPDGRIITRRELVRYEESFGRPPHVIASKLGNILYEKQKRAIHAELYCPLTHDIYLVGYIYVCNRQPRKERIGQELVEYVYDFAQVLTYALDRGGYFSPSEVAEHRYEAPIIDISASGLLFAHPRGELAAQLPVHTDLEVTLRFPDRKMVIGSRVRRRFQDAERTYYGIQFLSIDEKDRDYLFAKLYGRPFDLEEEAKWEGGTPPPPLDLFGGQA